jgi:thermostable 8-oxoguanine DNA glycosylase
MKTTEKLHNHPGLEKRLGFTDHVIIDRKTFEELMAQQIEDNQPEPAKVQLTDEEIRRMIVEEFNPREITLSDRELIIEGALWLRDRMQNK